MRSAFGTLNREATATGQVPPPVQYAPIELDPKIQRTLKPVKYGGDSPLAGRVWRVEGFERWLMTKRIAWLRAYIEDVARDPMIVAKATDIIRAAGAVPRDHQAQWAALLKFVQTDFYYVNEPKERFQSPQYSLSVLHGDCDDAYILLAALGASIRLPWRTVISGRDARRERCRWVEGIGRPDPTAEWAHIYLQVGGPAFHPTWWAWAEPTLPVPLGWDVMKSKGVLPEMARSRIAMGALGEIAVPVGGIVEKAHTFAKSLPWPSIAGTLMASVGAWWLTDRLKRGSVAKRRRSR
jgi:hypothetical protein